MTKKYDYFVKLLGTRPGWPEKMTPDEERIMDDHFAYLKDLSARGKVLMAGPCFEPVFGLIILRTDSEQEAVDLMDSEPSVMHGVHTYELHPMRVSLMGHSVPVYRYAEVASERQLKKKVILHGKLDEIWDSWTTTDGVKGVFAPDARVELRIGGPYEIYFTPDAAPGQRGSEDCRILSYVPREMLSFEWNAPPSFGTLRYVKTQVNIHLLEIEPGKVKLDFIHHGWGKSPEWEKLYDYFDRAWGSVLELYEKRFSGAD